MSFDIVCISCRTNGKIAKKNPFTGETIQTAIPGPLTEKEKKAVNDLLAEHDYDAGLVRLTDDLKLELDASDDLTSGMIFLRAATPEIFAFLFQIANVGNYVLCPAMDGNPAIVTSKEASTSASKARIFEPDATVHVVRDPHAIAKIIYPAFGDWDAYRAKVLRDSSD